MNKNRFLGVLAMLIIVFFGFYANGVLAYYNYYNYNNCTYHAYKLCVGNNIYWYDSCQNQQDLAQSCYGSNIVCQYGQCVYKQTTPNYNNYVAHYKISCYSNNLYWYDNLGVKTGLYKSCDDNNVCTLDTCLTGKCVNTIKCDGSTCATGTPDYTKYCVTEDNNNQNNNENNNNQDQNQNQNQNVNLLSVSFFAKENASSVQWQKTAQVSSNGQVYFLVSVANNSSTQADNVNVSVNIPAEVASLGNLQINGVPVTGDIVSGISVGSIAPATAKLLTFEGKTGVVSAQATKEASAKISVSQTTQSDSLSITFNPQASEQIAASVSSTESTSSFMDFLKRWYLWILAGLVLIFLFIVVFRRLSNNA